MCRRERDPVRAEVPRPATIVARVIASTRQSLRALLEEKRIRPDFFYRLTTPPVRFPSLRERLEDIPALVASMLAELGLEGSLDDDALLDPKFLWTIARYAWPGNIRQLSHHIERCSALGDFSLPTRSPSTMGSFRIAAPKADAMKIASRRAQKRDLTPIARELRCPRGNKSVARRTTVVEPRRTSLFCAQRFFSENSRGVQWKL